MSIYHHYLTVVSEITIHLHMLMINMLTYLISLRYSLVFLAITDFTVIIVLMCLILLTSLNYFHLLNLFLLLTYLILFIVFIEFTVLMYLILLTSLTVLGLRSILMFHLLMNIANIISHHLSISSSLRFHLFQLLTLVNSMKIH